MTYETVLTALADPTRRHILESLRERPRTVADISREHPVSRPAVSQHLKVLQRADLVQCRPEGTRRFYSVKQQGLIALRAYLDSFWSDVLTAYSAEIQRQMGEINAGSDSQDD